VTDFRTSTTPREIDAPHLRASQLTARPGTLPTITVPMTRTSVPDVEGIWRHLGEPAEFFGVRMPSRDDLSAAISAFVTAFANGTDPALFAATVTIAETRDAPQILVTGSTVHALGRTPVRVVDVPGVRLTSLASDPWWRRMAARTTSHGEADQCERWLNGRGYAEGLCDGVPALGALVFEIGGDVVGVENPEPTSVLDQLTRCGAIAPVDRVAGCPAGADRVWWLSPRFETHPVAEIDGTPFAVASEAVPPFARWS
jgi:hypothetical protein